MVKDTCLKILSTILLIAWSKKANTVVIWWKNIEQIIMTKEDDEYFENSTECWICDTAYVDSDVKVIDLSYHWKI